MAEYLVFTLSAALSAMGEFAGHERRGTLTMPGRAAILGLVAAALGIRRDEQQRLEALEALSVGVCLLDAGEPLRDFHTAQSVPSVRIRKPDSRAEALRHLKHDNPVVTVRDYRTGGLYVVGLRGPDLGAIEAALKRPVFCLYFGRKSCPLNAPPSPSVVEAAHVVEAMHKARLPPFRNGKGDPVRAVRYALDETLAADVPNALMMTETRNDRSIDRQAWHFTAREARILLPEALA